MPEQVFPGALGPPRKNWSKVSC